MKITAMVQQNKFNQTVWKVLQNIKEIQVFDSLEENGEIIYTLPLEEEYSPGVYRLNKARDEELKILEILKREEIGAISEIIDLEIQNDLTQKFPFTRCLKLKLVQNKFNELYEMYKNGSGYLEHQDGKIVIRYIGETINLNSLSLKDIKTTFDIEKDNPLNGHLILGDKSKLYTSDTFKYHVCKFMFSGKIIVGKSYSWDLIYSLKTPEPAPQKENWSSIYNAVYGINEDVQKILSTQEKLLTYDNKSVIRNF